MACAEHHGPPLLETTRVDGVKAPQHRGTPRSYHLVALLDLLTIIVLFLIIIERVVLDGADVHGVVAVGHLMFARFAGGCSAFLAPRAQIGLCGVIETASYGVREPLSRQRAEPVLGEI